MIHLVPKDGARVRDPHTKKIVGPEGVKIPQINTFWFRRLQDGEMIEAPKEQAQVETKKEKKEK